MIGKALRPNVGIGVDYAKPTTRLITLMYKDIIRELNRTFKECGYETAMDMSISSQMRITINALLKKWQKRFDKVAETSTDRMIERTVKISKVTLNYSLKELADAISIDKTYSNTILKEVIKASTEEAANLIKLIPQRALAEVQGAVMRSITTGQGMYDLVPFLKTKYKGNIKRARNTALDQTRKAYQSVNTTRLKAYGVKKFIWIHSGGGKTKRPLHVEMDGKEYDLNDPPYIGDMYGSKIYGLPADLPNCLPANSNVESFNGLNKLYRHRFTGVLTKLITESGEAIESTPNHPILTNRGWIACKDVKIGDYIVKARQQSSNIIESNITNDITTIGELFDSAISLFGIEITRSSNTGLEFHSDITDSEIDIIDITGSLPSEYDAEFSKCFCEFILTCPDPLMMEIGSFSDGSFDKFLMSSLGISDRFISSFGSVLSLFKSHEAHANNICLALVSYIATRFEQSFSDSSARNIELFRDLKFAKSIFIGDNNLICRQIFTLMTRAFDFGNNKTISADSLGEVIGINFKNFSDFNQSGGIIETFERVDNKIISEFSDHVYNLETKKNWYSSKGYIIHNCRCILKPVINFDEEDE